MGTLGVGIPSWLRVGGGCGGGGPGGGGAGGGGAAPGGVGTLGLLAN